MDTPEPVSADRLAELPFTWFRRRRRGRLRRALSALGGGVVVYGLAVALLVPPLVFLAAGLWSAVAYARTVFSLWDLFKNGQLQAFLDGLGGVELPMRLALASGAYFALLFALIVICSGLLARGWRLLFLAPGLLVAMLAALILVLDTQAAFGQFTMTLNVSSPLAPLATCYAIVDLAVLAALLTDLRPRLSRRGMRARAVEERGAPLPLVRFGPAVVSRPFVVRPLDAADLDATDGPPSDPTMTATVSKALDDSIPVAIVPITPTQHDDAPARERGEALTRSPAPDGLIPGPSPAK
jgi:hypothetical protein